MAAAEIGGQSCVTLRRHRMSKDLLRTIGVALVVWAVLLFTASRSTLWDRDEARYATAAIEMEATGNALYPTFNHELRAFQPALIYWLMSASIHVFGPSEIAARLPSTIAIALVCLLTGLLAREFFGSGVLAATIAGTSPMLMLTGIAATTDATLLLFTFLAQWIFVRAWLYGSRPWHVPAMGVAMGLALLTKGPVGLVIPALCISTALVLAKGRSQAGPFIGKLALACVLGCVIFLAWGLPANAATGGEYWRIAIVERLPQRVFTAMENHGGQGVLGFLLHLPYYPLVFVVGFLPWTLFLTLVRPAYKAMDASTTEDSWARSSRGLRALLVGMILPPFVFWTLIVSKLPHYIQPVFPWVALLVAGVVFTTFRGPSLPLAQARLRWVFFSFGTVAFVGAAGLLTLPWLPLPMGFSGVTEAGFGLGLMLFFILGLLGWCYWKGDIHSALKIHAAGMLVLLLACGFFVMPRLEAIIKPAQSLTREIASQIPSGARIASFGWHEPSMNFYLGGRRILHLYDPKSLGMFLEEPGPKFLILNEESAHGLSLPPDGFHLLARQSGFDHVKGRFTNLTALLRE